MNEYLYNELSKYKPYDEQEADELNTMLDFIKNNEDVLTRNNKVAHFTTSGWVFNKDKTKASDTGAIETKKIIYWTVGSVIIATLIVVLTQLITTGTLNKRIDAIYDNLGIERKLSNKEYLPKYLILIVSPSILIVTLSVPYS